MSSAAALWELWLVMALLGLLEALHSWNDGRRWAADLNRPRGRPAGTEPATLFLPCAGHDPGLEENLEAYFRQDYSDCQILLVTGDWKDASVPIIESVLARHPHRAARLLFAGPAVACGQKVHNLLSGLELVRECDRVFVFGDSDIRPRPDWMASLVDGLKDDQVGAATGFRWYLPQGPGWASRIRAAWNAGIAGLMKVRESPFAWGGAMAISRSRFEECGIAGSWSHSLSDDFSLSDAVRRRRLKIRFCPEALSFSHEDCSLAEFWNWSYRQMAITRVYNPGIWTLAWIAQSLNAVTLWGGMAGVVAASAGALSNSRGSLSLLIPGLVFGLGMLKADRRLRAVKKAFPEHRTALERDRWAYRLLGPVASLATLAALLRSSLSRTIEWRGIRYRMVSRDQTEVLPTRK